MSKKKKRNPQSQDGVQLSLFGDLTESLPSEDDMTDGTNEQSQEMKKVDEKHASAITGELTSKIDKIWEVFWSNGISNPLSVIEQISYLLFMRQLDTIETRNEKKANLLGMPFKERIFSEVNANARWSVFSNESDNNKMLEMVRASFEFIKTDLDIGSVGEASAYKKHMKDAVFLIPNASTLRQVVTHMNELPMGRDTLGDLYEYMLGKIASAGQNGQFRTPRHIINMMVEMIDLKATDTICDPACGTTGFLLLAAEKMRDTMLKGSKEQREHYQSKMFTGYDFDGTMLRIGALNMLLHGISNPTIENRNSLSDQNDDSAKFSVILANPPFKGSVAKDEISKDLTALNKTTKSEILFLRLFLRMLTVGGRAAVVVPDGVLFGSSNAHKLTRKQIIEGHKLQGVVSLPAGVFQPYSGVSTAILFFTRTDSGGTDHVWFYDMQNDGFSLNANRDPIDDNDIPDLLAKWKSRDPKAENDRKAKAFFVPKSEIVENDYDLSINRYKEIEYEEVQYDPPKTIIAQLEEIEAQIKTEMTALKEILG